MKSLLGQLVLLVTVLIAKFGSLAVLVLMALESANIPIPSEVILTYAGYLSSKGQLNFHLVVLAGALGCLLGSMVSYYLGAKLGRPFLWRYGKWLLISQKDIVRADGFLLKYGELTYFFSRLLPVVRTFISFVVGVSGGKFLKFCFYSFIGSWLWSYVLVWLGVKLGENWELVRPWWDKFSGLVCLLILLAVGWHVFRVFRDSRTKFEI
jgi:membrane protein DedA with SNARE-associated domain